MTRPAAPAPLLPQQVRLRMTADDLHRLDAWRSATGLPRAAAIRLLVNEALAHRQVAA